jgi:hypothetical protein
MAWRLRTSSVVDPQHTWSAIEQCSDAGSRPISSQAWRTRTICLAASGGGLKGELNSLP